MHESILQMSKRTDSSHTNYTQIGDYTIKKHLGAGAFASVKLAVHNSTGMLIAAKMYDKVKLGLQIKLVHREISVLKKLDHENLPKLFDVIDTPNQLYLIMEHVPGSNLLV
jgi:serine/threonine protein kinase